MIPNNIILPRENLHENLEPQLISHLAGYRVMGQTIPSKLWRSYAKGTLLRRKSIKYQKNK